MRIGLNLLYLLPGVVGGTETYAAGLLDGLAEVGHQHDFFAFVNRESREWPLPTRPNFHRILCPISATHRARRYTFEQLCMPILLRKYELDLLHSLGYVAPICLPCPSVVTIHDLNYQAFGSGMATNKRAALAVFVHQAAMRADRIITPSRFSRKQILDSYRDVPPERIVVIEDAVRRRHPLQVSREQAMAKLERYGLRQPYLMAFGNRGANKNVPRLVLAYKKAREQYGISHQLVIAGRLSPSDLKPYTEGLEATNLIVTGYLEDISLQVLLRHASMFVIASTYEGFGLPVLEAMEAGVPVVSSNAAALPEVCGNAAVLFDPFSIDDMAAKIASVASDESLQDRLIELGRENISRFSWTKAAIETLNTYQEAVRLR